MHYETITIKEDNETDFDVAINNFYALNPGIVVVQASFHVITSLTVLGGFDYFYNLTYKTA
jgi:hypothetical protein